MMIYDELIKTRSSKVLIIDDNEKEVESIIEALHRKEISNVYRKVDLIDGGENEEQPIDGIELVILDLQYEPYTYVVPELCADQIQKGVVEGQPYYLVGWTKDPDEITSVVDKLRERNLSPLSFTAMKKDDYRKETKKSEYLAENFFIAINEKLKESETIQEFLGKIIDVEETAILILCIIIDDPEVFEVRRFDLLPFANYIPLAIGTIIKIRITTKPGSRIFEFSEEDQDKSTLFIKPDDFDDLDDLSFLTA